MIIMAKEKPVQKQHEYYEWDKAKQIPILDVCAHFGIEVIYRSGTPWCRLRPSDKTPSTCLHTDASDRWKENTFYDFGIKESGDNIALACKMLGLDSTRGDDRYTAMVYLSKSFHIPPRNSEGKCYDSLTDSEYKKIGLYGDLATKNFHFNFDRRDMEENQRISEKYHMPMNQLKKDHPRTFERLLKTIAIPHVKARRNDYYMDLWLTNQNVVRSFGTDLLSSPSLIETYNNTAKDLQGMDRILNRAISGTSLKPIPLRDYTPGDVLSQINTGKIKPEFGNKSHQQMQRLAKTNGTTLKFRVLDLVSTYYESSTAFGKAPFSAFMSGGKAIVGYLEKDIEEFRSAFEQLAYKDPSKGKSRLKDKLTDATTRKVSNETLHAVSPHNIVR